MLLVRLPPEERIARAHPRRDRLHRPRADPFARRRGPRNRGPFPLPVQGENGRPRARRRLRLSAIGYYGDRGEAELVESEPPGRGFLAGLAKDWEAAAASAEPLGLRVVRLRVGWVLGRGAPFLGPQLPLFRLGLGGPLGSGNQWWPWVHLDDVVGLYRRALEDDGMRGPVNATAPAPVRQRDFAKAVGRVLGRPALLPAPSLAIRLVLGEFAAEVLDSRRVLPRAAEAAGHTFAYTDLDAALRDALGGP